MELKRWLEQNRIERIDRMFFPGAPDAQFFILENPVDPVLSTA